MLGQASDKFPAMQSMLHLYVPDVDAVYKRAIEAGGKSVREPTNEFYGDRSSGVVDPAGNQWWIATHVEDVTPEEMEKRMKQPR
jgi:PhnB protein